MVEQKRVNILLFFFLANGLIFSLSIFPSSDTNFRKREIASVSESLSDDNRTAQTAAKKNRGHDFGSSTSTAQILSQDAQFLEGWQSDLEKLTKKRFATQEESDPGLLNFAINQLRNVTTSIASYTPELISPVAGGSNSFYGQAVTDNYEVPIQDRNFLVLLENLEKATDAVINEKFKNARSALTVLAKSAGPSKETIESWINSLRAYLSYGKSDPNPAEMEKIAALYNEIFSLKDTINHHFGSLRDSVLYRPGCGQSVFDAFVSYAFFPEQLDHLFEVPVGLRLRSRIQYLLCLSASHNNLLALHYAQSVFDERSEDEDTLEADQAYEYIRSKIKDIVKEKDSSALSGSSFYSGTFWRARLEKNASLQCFTQAQKQGDMRGFYECLIEKYDAKILSQLKSKNPGLAYLVKAHFEKETSKKIKAYELSASNGIAYAYARIGELCKETNKDTALENFCRAFQNGHYSAIDDIVKLCQPASEQKKEFDIRIQALKNKYLNVGLNPDFLKILAAKFKNI